MSSQSSEKTGKKSTREHGAKPFLDDPFIMVMQFLECSEEELTEDMKGHWRQYVDMCLADELHALELQGRSKKKAKKLVPRRWVRRAPDADGLIFETAPPDDTSEAVPVIMVHRDGRFELHPRLSPYLYWHPLLRGSKTPDLGPRGREVVLHALEQVDALEDKLGIEWSIAGWYLSGKEPDSGGKASRAVERAVQCGSAANQLRSLLNPEHGETDSDGNHAWLPVALAGEQFWQLLDTAIRLGKALERRRILDDQDGEEIMRRMITNPPGSQAGSIGNVIEELIEQYTVENGSPPTPTDLLDWLGGERPYNDKEPLLVNHASWNKTMENVSWESFQEGIKRAKRRMRRVNQTRGKSG